MPITALRTAFITFFLVITLYTYAQAPANDNCSGAVLLISSISCSTTGGTVLKATNSNLAAGTCGGNPDDDVWYRFVAASTNHTITINPGKGNPSLTKSGSVVELFKGACGTLTSIGCGPTSVSATNLTVGTTYYVRVYSTPLSFPTGNADFTICVTHLAPPTPPVNDECNTAVLLNLGSTNSSGTVWGATASSNIPVDCASGTPDDDVWYKFTANGSTANITLSAIGTNLSSSGARLQLFSGSCGSITSIACGGTSLDAAGLTKNSTYFIRVYSSGAGAIGGTSAGSAFSITVTGTPILTQTNIIAGRMNEVFQQTTLSGAGLLSDPWEITYGKDDYLWITEAKGYKVYRMDPNTGVKSTVLDISQGSTFLADADRGFNVQFSTSQSPWPQGGMAGLALHPQFMDPATPQNYVFVSYVHKYVSTAPSGGGVFFTNRLVRFYYNTTTGKMESPVSLCDELPGSSDHNSQRMIIAPVNGVNYLFYAHGDMGAGQFDNANRPIKSQIVASYEGKILRFNIDPDGDAGLLDKWIPNDNPFNGVDGIAQSAVWSTGIRNNQGFAYAKINGVDYLYGSSHGPFSDDEINIIEKGKNYGHPLVIGYSADGNYNNSKAGSATGSLPLITSEAANATAIGASYRDPIFSIYAAPRATVNNIYLNNPSNSGWPSEAPSGMDIYTNTLIPGWKNSLLMGLLKGGRVFRLKLNSAGNAIATSDTISYFRSVNRFRDVALAPDGKTVFTVIDKSSVTSGPTSTNPIVSACAGCVLKYTFLGYHNDVATNKSTIPISIDVTNGTSNNCNNGTTITIDNSNNNLWVPITGQDGNILAEIKANGNNLGVVTSSFYINSKAVREDASKQLYLNRNITITPQVQPSSPVSIRLYLTANELADLRSATNSLGVSSGVTSISDLSLYKNNDPCSPAIASTATKIIPVYLDAHGSSGFVLQAEINSFSSFYFGGSKLTVLPLELLYFKGELQNKAAALQWETANEQNTLHFVVERSIDGSRFDKIAIVPAHDNSSSAIKYTFTDQEAANQASDIIYYRLKMVDKDGSMRYSKVVRMEIPQNIDFIIFPNPVKSILNIRLNNKDLQKLSVQISDLQGRIIYTKNLPNQRAINFEVDAHKWKPQLYIIKIMGRKDEVLIVQKFNKL